MNNDLELEKPYDESGDYVLYKIPENYTPVTLSDGMFCILFQEDGHMPGKQLDGPNEVLKVVVKVKAN